MLALAMHLAKEEPDITSIAIMPGRVDTDMQRELREQGKATMAELDHTGFVQAFEQGELFRPNQPGDVCARLVTNPPAELSGKHLKYDKISLIILFIFKLVFLQESKLTEYRWFAPELQAYQDEA
jgi:NAD(P)-dependent dehydrogenase (short-subunit alcohol dehydrogenase family)